MKGRPGCDFSFSGLKTAVRQTIEKLGDTITEQDKCDIAASFQAAVADSLIDRSRKAIDLFAERHPGANRFVIAGGVAANTYLRERLAQLTARNKFDLVVPPGKLCTDNGAMIAWAGLERLRAGLTDSLDISARARWPLDPDAAPVPFAGAKA